MRQIARHALPGIALCLLTLWLSWAPVLFLLAVLVTTPPLLRQARRKRHAAELTAARRLYFGQWADKVDPIWLPQDVKDWFRPPRRWRDLLAAPGRAVRALSQGASAPAIIGSEILRREIAEIEDKR